MVGATSHPNELHEHFPDRWGFQGCHKEGCDCYRCDAERGQWSAKSWIYTAEGIEMYRCPNPKCNRIGMYVLPAIQHAARTLWCAACGRQAMHPDPQEVAEVTDRKDMSLKERLLIREKQTPVSRPGKQISDDINPTRSRQAKRTPVEHNPGATSLKDRLLKANAVVIVPPKPKSLKERIGK